VFRDFPTRPMAVAISQAIDGALLHSLPTVQVVC
jgi:hypothetical protein